MRFAGFFVVSFVIFSVAHPAAHAASHDWTLWLRDFKAEAGKAGISAVLLNEALPETFQPIDRVIELDRKQPEQIKSFTAYTQTVVSAKRVQTGQIRYRNNKSLLYEISSNYGVEPQYIVALWGIETNFGQNTGGFDVIHALATLAFDGRRPDFFRHELLKALQIVANGDVKLLTMKGSWAGAMGQCQFMPSSFFTFAQDYNKDGRRDIWKTEADVFASTAHYLSQSGWKHGQPWGRKVSVPKDFAAGLVGLDRKYSLRFWHAHGVRLPNGDAVPFEGDDLASLIQPDGVGTTPYIVYDNYRVIMKWNKSTYFATAVGLLADQIKG